MRADRLLAILLLLQSRPSMTTSALATELGVARRTILRDINALCMVGIPIMTQSGSGGGVSLDAHYRLSLNGLREAEVRALFLAGNAKLVGDIWLGAAMESMRAKLFAALPLVHQHAVQNLNAYVHIDPSWWNDSHRHRC